MAWEAWVLVVLYGVSIPMMPFSVGRPRPMQTAWSASAIIVLYVFIIWLVLRLASVL